jgi:serine/threonine protein kinase/tetratricopeptide (TPR) repeat protein
VNESEIFTNALKRATPEERAAYLDTACAGNPQLRDEVEALLNAHATNPGFLEEPGDLPGDSIGTSPTGGDATDLSSTPASECAGRVIGPYKLIEEIGEGGMGTVYMAKQTEPIKRLVALKVIKPGMDSRQVIARFEAERQALALMDQPNIARVFDAGTTESGRPYFVMELVKGVPLTTYCDEHRLTPEDRLKLFIPVCQAIQHAHQKGIIHRDIKPSNVLVALYDGEPVPKVIDFGVAKAAGQRLTENTLVTSFGAVVGTLEYMSPEQAELNQLDIDTRSDIYSLGVLLYELLTGTTPLDRKRLKEAAILEMLRIIREEEPPKPSTRLSTNEDTPSVAANRGLEPKKLSGLVRGELDWIVMKALEKDRNRRYESANGLARDIRRHLDGDTVEACPPSASYKLRKFVRRHRWGLATVGSFAALLVAATAISISLAFWANRERVRAKNAETSAKKQRTRAEDREQMAIDAVKRFRDVVATNPALKRTQELEQLRKTLLQEPLAFFRALRDRLQSDRDTRPESLARLGQASFDLGGLSKEIGDKQDALTALQESLAIRQKLADANPTETEFQRALASSHNNIGNLLSMSGRSVEALSSYEAARAILRKLANANPAVVEIQRELATCHRNIGLVLSQTGKPAEALKAYESGLAIQQELADAHTSVARFQRDLAASHDSIGNLMFETGRPAEALKAHESALAIRTKLVAATPAETECQNELASSYNNIGIVLSGRGKLVEALKAYEAALSIKQKLAEANPAATAIQASPRAGGRSWRCRRGARDVGASGLRP